MTYKQYHLHKLFNYTTYWRQNIQIKLVKFGFNELISIAIKIVDCKVQGDRRHGFIEYFIVISAFKNLFIQNSILRNKSIDFLIDIFLMHIFYTEKMPRVKYLQDN